MLSQKDIVEVNKSFSTGVLVNGSSLDYAVKAVARSKNWLRAAAVLSRAILVDHIFEDGNKRTAAAVIMLLMDMQGIAYDPEEIPKIVLNISRKSITSIPQLERCIKNAIR